MKKKYYWLPDGKLAIRDGSILHRIIMRIPWIIWGYQIGKYEIIRIGSQTNWNKFNWTIRKVR